MNKVCTRCKRELDLSAFARSSKGDANGLRAQCRDCCGEYNRAWKREHPENHRAYNASWIERHPEATFAHYQLRNAVRRGELARPTSCESCGGTGRVHGHHDDYDRPLDVVWLCAVCHAARR
jgi:hypothetical protein